MRLVVAVAEADRRRAQRPALVPSRRALIAREGRIVPSSGSASAMSATRSPCSQAGSASRPYRASRDALRELILVGEKGHQHADRERARITARAPKKMMTIRSSPNSIVLAVLNIKSSFCTRRSALTWSTR